MAPRTPKSDSTPKVGQPAPGFTLADQHGQQVSLGDLAGGYAFVYFYPKALTSGCTTQAVSLSESADDLDGVRVVGISPDPVARLDKFDTDKSLGFTLLSDEDHLAAEAYGVWVLKKLYGREYMGVQRSGFLIGPDGVIVAAWPKISPKDTVPKLTAALADARGRGA